MASLWRVGKRVVLYSALNTLKYISQKIKILSMVQINLVIYRLTDVKCKE